MLKIAFFTVRAMIKDRIFYLISSMILLFILVPVFSSFSMRQIQEVSITMSLSLNSFILLFLAMFGGVVTVWRDIERKYAYTILSNPISRTNYFIGRFLGFAIILAAITIINMLLSAVVIKISAGMYQSRLPIIWSNIAWAAAMTLLKYLILMGFGFLFTSFATSFFIPFFGTIIIYIVGNASQGVYDYLSSAGTSGYSAIFKYPVKFLYYIIPNFSSFDLTTYAVYALKINYSSILYSLAYFVLYLGIVLSLSVAIFNKKDLV